MGEAEARKVFDAFSTPEPDALTKSGIMALKVSSGNHAS